MIKYTVKFAETPDEFKQVEQLRYNELVLVYNNQTEAVNDISKEDSYAKLLIAKTEQGEVVGTYRLISYDSLPKDTSFDCESEFDITHLKQISTSILELSRAVIKQEHRNGSVLLMLMSNLLKYISDNNFRFIVGDVSFFGSDKNQHLEELSYLYHYCKLDDSYGIKSLDSDQPQMLDVDKFDQTEAYHKLPALIKMYLKLGAKFPDTYFSDYKFGSVDAFVVVDSHTYNKTYVDKLIEKLTRQ